MVLFFQFAVLRAPGMNQKKRIKRHLKKAPREKFRKTPRQSLAPLRRSPRKGRAIAVWEKEGEKEGVGYRPKSARKKVSVFITKEGDLPLPGGEDKGRKENLLEKISDKGTFTEFRIQERREKAVLEEDVREDRENEVSFFHEEWLCFDDRCSLPRKNENHVRLVIQDPDWAAFWRKTKKFLRQWCNEEAYKVMVLHLTSGRIEGKWSKLQIAKFLKIPKNRVYRIIEQFGRLIEKEQRKKT